jgi:hypothetical protein
LELEFEAFIADVLVDDSIGAALVPGEAEQFARDALAKETVRDDYFHWRQFQD